MFVFLKRVIKKFLGLIGLNKVIYRISSNEFIDIDDRKLKTARAFLEAQSPDPRSSCICENQIEARFDLHIIIPAYNVERYIKTCLDSVVNSATCRYSYIVTVINDGSTDGTAEILKNYASNKNIEVINQENKGFSGARNAGLRHIKGSYVLFLDSDDCMDWSGVEKLLETAHKTDAEVVAGSYTMIDAVGRKRSFRKRKCGELKAGELDGMPWAKVFKAQVFEHVCFPEKYWYEDSIFAQLVYPTISRAYGIGENTYCYRVHSAGITSSGMTKVKSIDSYWITEQLFKEREKIGLMVTEEYYNYILRMVYLTFYRIQFQSDEVKKSVFMLFVDFICKNFDGLTTKDDRLKELEKIVKTKNFGKCIAFAKWM